MDLVLALLIGVAVGFSLGVYIARRYKANPRPEAWQREVIREISSWLGQELDKTLIKLGEGLQVWGKDLTQAISVKLAEHSEQLNSRQAILEIENLVKEARGIYQQLQVALKKSSRLEISQATDQNSQKEQAAIHKTIENSLPDDVPRDKEKVAASNMQEVDMKIESFLNSKKIKIKRIYKRSIDMEKKEEKLDRIADLMGRKYSLIKKFYEKIKSNMNSGNSFSINLRDEPQQVIGTTCHVATELHRIKFLEEYGYYKASKRLEARASRSSEAQNFLSGKWLERYVMNRLICLAKRQTGKIDFACVANAEVTLPDRDDFEMDLLFRFNDQFYWVESTTGEYQDKVQKYSKIASDLLGLQRNQAIMVLTDVSQDAKTRLSSLYHLSVISVDEVEATFERILEDLKKSPSRSLKGTQEH